MKKSSIFKYKIPSAIALAAILAFSSINAPALARSQNIKVPANKTSLIWYQTAFSEATCTAIDIRDYSLVQPKNGKFTVTKKRFKLPKGKCKGSTVNTLHISYTPKSGFHGKDQGAFSFKYNSHDGSTQKRTRKTTFNITVN